MGQPGGWPLTMFLTPKGVPFFAGTYLPEGRALRPAGRSRRVLNDVAQLYREQPDPVAQNGDRASTQQLNNLWNRDMRGPLDGNAARHRRAAHRPALRHLLRRPDGRA